MNPFSEAIEATRRPSAIYTPSKLNILLHDLQSPDAKKKGVSYVPTLPSDNQNITDDETVDEVEDEVYSLISRLRQLVGDIDSQPILDQLRAKQEKTKTQKLCKEEKPKPLHIDTEAKILEKPKQNTRFALASPLIIKEKSIWEEPPESPGTGTVEGPFQRPSLSSTSRYSLGANRFSIRAQEISADTLNYVNGSKLLRNTTRSAMMTPDPYAFISPVAKDTAKKHFSFTASAKSSSISPPSKTSTVISNFVEFCVIGVENDMLMGLKSLENSSLQPTEVIDLYPGEASRAAIVGNLNEYCFPYGAELKYMTHKDLEDLKAISQVPSGAKPGTSFHNSAHAFGLQFQIMQFTDIHNVVYYATCVISPEPLEHVCPTLQANMHNLLNLIAASNTIKRYMAYFLHRRRQALNEELNAEWQHNLEKARDLGNVSRAGGTKSVVSSITFGSSTDSKGVIKPKSFFRTLKKAIGGLRAKGGSAESVKGTGILSSSLGTGTGSETASVQGSPHQSMFKTFRQGSGSTLNSPVVPQLVRQRSLSHDSPALTRAGTKSSVESGSHDSVAQVHVDGSPLKISKNFRGKLHRSNKRVAIVTQKAYCIISDKPMHALFFQILEAIALKERERALARWTTLPTFSTKDALTPSSSGNSSPALCESPKEKNALNSNKARQPPLLGLFRDPSTKLSGNSHSAHLVKRNEFLSYVQSYDFGKISTTMHSKRAVSVPRNSLKFIELSMAGYIKSIKISYKALMLKEWTVAILIALLPSELIIKIHSQLLQEQSLLVYGTDAGMVTAVVSAFTLLLQPFSWEGIYVPLLPMAAYEALDAPVPFVIGVVANSRPAVPISSSAGVLRLNDFIHHPEQYVPSCFDDTAMRHTLASRDEKHLRDTRFRRNFIYPEDGSTNNEIDLGLKFFEAPCPDESKQGIPPLLDPMQCSQLKELHQFIAYHSVKIRASLKFAQIPRAGPFNSTCAIKAVMNDLNDEALRSLSHVLNRVLTYNTSICGEVLSQPGGWRQFGVLNSRTNQFEFLPDLFMAPLKAHLRLQECVINTQLFVSFMDAQSETYLKLQPQRIFISEWVYFRMQRRKHRKRRSGRPLTLHKHL